MKNQMMEVRLGDYGSVTIGHKTKMGKADDIIVIGNLIREQKGLRPLELPELLRKQSLWEFIIIRNSYLQSSKYSIKSITSNSAESAELEPIENVSKIVKPDYSVFGDCIDKHGKVKYGELVKLFPNVIQTKRGKYGGTYLELYILLDLAAMLDSEFKHEVYKQFIEGRILQLRDEGGEAFKALNNAIDTLPDRQPELKPKGNKGVYIQASKLIREKLEIVSTFGYNEDEHDAFVQGTRTKLLELLIQNIELGFIRDYPTLKDTIMRFKVVKS